MTKCDDVHRQRDTFHAVGALKGVCLMTAGFVGLCAGMIWVLCSGTIQKFERSLL